MLAAAEAKRPPYGASGPRHLSAVPAVGQHALAVAMLVLAPLLLFGPGIVAGEVFYGKDTVQFYYPLTEWFFNELKRGWIPLWLPYIFGGYPLFADGEIGMAHPLVLLAGALLPADAAFVWLRSLHFSLAAVCAYWLATVLGIGRAGSMITGLVFAFSSFLVGHMQHDNILRSAVWLPALLALIELSLRATGTHRLRYLLLAGLVVGVQCLGIHVQPVLISLVAAAGWIVVGPVGALDWATEPPNGTLRAWLARAIRNLGALASFSPWRSAAAIVLGRVARLWMCALVTGTGIAVAAVQLGPLFALSNTSIRGEGVNYFVSTSYAVSPPELITLVLPFFFRTGPEQHWSLWPPQETTVYFGVMPLLLAAIALVCVRRRLVLWLSLGALVHLWLSLGDYITPNPYYWLWSLPGFSVMRAPARFSLVVTLAVACLAGIGVDWLARHARAETPLVTRHRVKVVLALWSAAVLLLGAVGVAVRTAMYSAPSQMMDIINLSYLTFRRETAQLGSPAVFSGLASALDPSNPSTRLAIIWMMLSPAIVLFAIRMRRHLAVWQPLIVGVVAADLLSFGGAFYPQARAADIHTRHPVISELVARSGHHHVLLDPGLYSIIGANQLVHYGVASAGGYSSLEPSRYLDYWWGMVRDENVLLDLFNVRYVAMPRQAAGWLMFNETRFHPAERLLNGAAENPAGSETFHGYGVTADRVILVSAVQGLGPDWNGEEIGEIVLVGTNGERSRFGLRYGMELTDFRAGAPPPSNARQAYAGPSFSPTSRSFPAQLYGAVLRVGSPVPLDRLEIRYTAPVGSLLVHGLGLRDAATMSTRSITSMDRMKYQRIYESDDAIILENQQALPKAFFAPSAAPTDVARPTAADLVSTPRNVITNLVIEQAGHSPAAASVDEPAQATLLTYGSEGLSASVSAASDGYLVIGDRYDPGWRAWVDGKEAPVLRANAVLRAVPVTAGEHHVELRYAPWWIPVSIGASGFALLAIAASLFVLRLIERRAALGST